MLCWTNKYPLVANRDPTFKVRIFSWTKENSVRK